MRSEIVVAQRMTFGSDVRISLQGWWWYRTTSGGRVAAP